MKVIAFALVVAGGVAASGQTFLVDTNFPGGSGPDGYVRAIAVQSDGRVLVGGDFSHFHGTYRPGLVRLLPDGSFDPSFDAAITQSVRGIELDVDGGGVLVSGVYTNDTRTRPGVVKLREDGSVDPGFALPALLPASATLSRLYSAGGGKLWLSGTFTNVGGVATRRIARLHADGSVDTGRHSARARLAVLLFPSRTAD